MLFFVVILLACYQVISALYPYTVAGKEIDMGEKLLPQADVFSASLRFPESGRLHAISKGVDILGPSPAVAEAPPSNRLLDVVDALSEKESLAIKAEKHVAIDMLVIGTGPHATAFLESYKEKNPAILSLFVDKSEKRGGQFRNSGEPYILNSPNVVLPGMKSPFEGKFPNSFGKNLPVRLEQVSKNNVPSSAEIGFAASVNNYAVAPAVLGMEIVGIEKSDEQFLRFGKYKILGKDMKSGEHMTFYANAVVHASGMGEVSYGLPEETKVKQSAAQSPDAIFSFPDFMSRLGKYSQEAIQKQIKNGIAVIGGKGDSAKVALEKLIEKTNGKFPQEAQIDVYGSDFDSKETYLQAAIDRYKQLGSYIGHGIRGMKEKVVGIAKKQSRIVLTNAKGSMKDYGLVIFATGFTSFPEKLFGNILGQKHLEPVKSKSGEIAKKVPGETLFIIGPAANIPYSGAERNRIDPMQQNRYKNSLGRLIPKSMEAAGYVSQEMHQKAA